MNLDLLISKYIDGELTAQEDVQLRNLLKEDPLAREEFDNFLELHLAMIEDADTIVIPNSVRRATEDRVMMTILNDTPRLAQLPKKSYNFYYKVASLAIFLMFAFLFQINDKFYQFTEISENTNADYINFKVSNVADLEKPSSKIKRIKNGKAIKSLNHPTIENIEANDNITTKLSDVAVVTNNSIDNNSIIEEKLIVDNKDFQAKPISEDNNYQINNNAKVELTNSNIDLVDPNNYGQFDPFNNYTKSDINLSTSISFDFVRNGLNTFDNSAIKNYSQSISYSINNQSRIGLEFGMTEFYYPNTRFIKVGSSIESNSMIEVLDPTSGDNALLVPITVRETEKNYWGTVFFEQNILNYNEFAIDGRIGLGSNSDGFLGITRLVAKYNIISGLYLSAGAEGRSFSYKLPLKNSSGFVNNLSYVWGIYFQF